MLFVSLVVVAQLHVTCFRLHFKLLQLFAAHLNFKNLQGIFISRFRYKVVVTLIVILLARVFFAVN